MIRTGKLRKFEALGAHVSLPTPESPKVRDLDQEDKNAKKKATLASRPFPISYVLRGRPCGPRILKLIYLR